MLQNFIKIALRNLERNKVYSFINIFGLSVGIGCCILLCLYIQHELSFDKHHKDGENIYRVTTLTSFSKDNRPMKTTSAPIVWGIKDEVPEFETVTRLVNPPNVAKNLIRYEDKLFYESNGFVADSTLFDIFTYEFVEGQADNALTEANSVVLTQKLAQKLFGDEPAINKVININQGGPGGDFRVTAVVSDKYATHINANFFVSMTSGGWGAYLRSPEVMDEWAGQNFLLSYVKLKPNHDIAAVTKKVNAAFMRHGAEDVKRVGFKKELGLEPMQDIYLRSLAGNDSPRIVYIYVIASIAAFILLIACINFMNLSTAKATKRANEVGLRKTLGAVRTSLIGQFLGEALVIVTIAIGFSLVMVQLALPMFNDLTGKTLTFASENIFFIAGALIAITVITGVIAGSYPAFYLSSFQPASVLKGKSLVQSSNSTLRKSLVVFQFVIAICLVCGMIVISKQLNYIQEKNLGFNADNKIVLPLRTASATSNFETLRTEIGKLSAVDAVSGSVYVPGAPIFHDLSLYRQGGSMETAINIRNNPVEPNFIKTLGIKLIAGRDFTDNREAEKDRKIIVNKEAVKRFGFTPDEIVGQPLFFEWQGNKYEYEVIGVMDDYHQVSLKEEIYPLLFYVPAETANHDHILVSTTGGDFKGIITQLETKWKTIVPDTPFEYFFLDQNVENQYNEDKKTAAVITSFTVIAMIISCLGLYGLSTYMAEQRFKEIGVRKVLGATVKQIVGMMSGEFLKLVVIAFIIAVPISWYGANKWLEGFAYRTTTDVTIFVIAGGAAFVIALLTISFESLRAASSNPVKALRNE
jgi:putative ABC transport system permease protein